MAMDGRARATAARLVTNGRAALRGESPVKYVGAAPTVRFAADAARWRRFSPPRLHVARHGPPMR
jgi:hypothetical protein